MDKSESHHELRNGNDGITYTKNIIGGTSKWK